METWQVRVCPFEVKSGWTIRIHTGMKMGLWPWNPAFISPLLQRSMKGLKQLKRMRPRLQQLGLAVNPSSFSEQSARAIHSITSFKPGTEALFTVRRGGGEDQWALPYESVQTAMFVKHDGERAKTMWKEQSHQLNFNIIWNVLELEETMAGLMTGRLPPSPGIRFSWEESVEPGDESRQPGITARRGRLDEEDWWGCAERGGGLILNDKREELWSY